MSMLQVIDTKLTQWRQKVAQQPKVVLLTADPGHKAFCAGGDVAQHYRDANAEEPRYEAIDEFHFTDFGVEYLLSTASFCQISIWDGVVMGSGVGQSIHSKIRIATEKTVWAMPEAGLGLFTDVGAGWFLPKLVDGQICFGLYLAFTGRRIMGRDAVKWGIATHFVESKDIEAMKHDLIYNTDSSSDDSKVYQIIEKYAKMGHREPFGLKHPYTD